MPSKFGYIVTGKCPDIDRSTQSDHAHTLYVVTEVNQVAPEVFVV